MMRLNDSSKCETSTNALVVTHVTRAMSVRANVNPQQMPCRYMCNDMTWLKQMWILNKCRVNDASPRYMCNDMNPQQMPCQWRKRHLPQQMPCAPQAVLLVQSHKQSPKPKPLAFAKESQAITKARAQTTQTSLANAPWPKPSTVHHQYSNTTTTNTQIRPIRPIRQPPILKYDLYVQYSNTTYTSNTQIRPIRPIRQSYTTNTTELHRQYSNTTNTTIPCADLIAEAIAETSHRRMHSIAEISSQNAFYCGNLIAECISPQSLSPEISSWYPMRCFRV